jgi:hypothetical protein
VPGIIQNAYYCRVLGRAAALAYTAHMRQNGKRFLRCIRTYTGSRMPYPIASTRAGPTRTVAKGEACAVPGRRRGYYRLEPVLFVMLLVVVFVLYLTENGRR